jgi:hypothetical protein
MKLTILAVIAGLSLFAHAEEDKWKVAEDAALKQLEANYPSFFANGKAPATIELLKKYDTWAKVNARELYANPLKISIYLQYEMQRNGQGPDAGNTQQTPAATQALSDADLAAAYQEALQSFLSTGGGLQPNLRDRKGPTYKNGAVRGLTEDQAVEKFKEIWVNTSPEERAKYAERARLTGGAGNQPSTNNENQEAERLRMEARLRELERKNMPGADPDAP